MKGPGGETGRAIKIIQRHLKENTVLDGFYGTLIFVSQGEGAKKYRSATNCPSSSIYRQELLPSPLKGEVMGNDR